MPTARVDAQTSVHYLVGGAPAGTGAPDLVLIHGTGGGARISWGHLLDPLAGSDHPATAARRVIALDYSGAGDTTDDGAPLTLPGLAAQVRAVIDDAGSASFDLLGFSLGACVAAYLAADAELGHGLRKLVLLSGWVDSVNDPRAALQFALWEHLDATDRRALAEQLALSGFSADYLAGRPANATEQAIRNTVATLAPGFARHCDLDRRVDLTAELPRISAPTLVLAAGEDQMVPARHARALAAAIPGARTAELAGIGHLSIYEAPGVLAATVTGFLEE